MTEGISLQFLPHEHELLKERCRILEEFVLVVVNNGGGNVYSHLPDRPDLFEWLCSRYQHQLDAFFDEIEDLESQRDSLRNQVNHDPGI